MDQRSRLEGAAGAVPVRVLPFGIIMRYLKEREHPMGMGATQESRGEAVDAALAGVRLSPIERANLHAINDPALAGYAPACARPSAEDGSSGVCGQGSARASLSPEAGQSTAPVDELGRIEDDVIVVGPHIRSIAHGQEGPRAHVRVEVHPDNPCYMSDGCALYTKDGKELVRLVVPVESYEVLSGCERIGERAFDSASSLARVALPSSLRSIGRLAFAKTDIACLDVPLGVEEIGEKACYGCRALKACILPETLRGIGASAFANSSVERVRIPAKVEAVGLLAFAGTPAARGAHRGAITVDEANEVYEMDADGGMYRHDELVELLSCVAEYAVRPGTARIGDDALRRDLHIRYVSLPEGITHIGDGAFQGCRNLFRVDLPESLEWIGDRAFTDTAIPAMRIGSAVAHIGDDALLIQGSSPARCAHLLRGLELDEANERFYVESGLLCECGAGYAGGDKALAYVGPDALVRIPDAVNQIAPHALFGAVEVDELIVHDHMQSIARASLALGRAPRLVQVQLRCASAVADETVPGAGQAEEVITLDLTPPSLTPRYRDLTDMFATAEGRTIVRFPYYDAWVTHCGDGDEFARAAVERLRCPWGMKPDVREVYESIFRRKELPICMHCARHGDLDALAFLADEGYISLEAIQGALEEATTGQEVQATACLLELSRRMVPGSRLDLSI